MLTITFCMWQDEPKAEVSPHRLGRLSPCVLVAVGRPGESEQGRATDPSEGSVRSIPPVAPRRRASPASTGHDRCGHRGGGVLGGVPRGRLRRVHTDGHAAGEGPHQRLLREHKLTPAHFC